MLDGETVESYEGGVSTSVIKGSSLMVHQAVEMLDQSYIQLRPTRPCLPVDVCGTV